MSTNAPFSKGTLFVPPATISLHYTTCCTELSMCCLFLSLSAPSSEGVCTLAHGWVLSTWDGARHVVDTQQVSLNEQMILFHKREKFGPGWVLPTEVTQLEGG